MRMSAYARRRAVLRPSRGMGPVERTRVDERAKTVRRAPRACAVSPWSCAKSTAVALGCSHQAACGGQRVLANISMERWVCLPCKPRRGPRAWLGRYPLATGMLAYGETFLAARTSGTIVRIKSLLHPDIPAIHGCVA
ncbi:hypothetical protein C8Q73DRAFT_698552 [Cubamyces lactineus]|nr:hypothetical protein C8Q73DRAFT_698552 [Cubamyces lactineus]